MTGFWYGATRQSIRVAAGVLIAGLFAGLVGVTATALAVTPAVAETGPTPSPSGTQLPQLATSVPDATATPSPLPTATTGPIVKPAKVRDFLVTDDSIGSLTLAWTQPLAVGADPILDYKVMYKFDQYKNWVVWKHIPFTANTVTIPDLPLDNGFSFSVRAITARASSIAVSTHAFTPRPSAPTGLNALVQKQYNFLAATWNSHSSAKFGYLPGVDCANWASQSLLQRGFSQTPKWRAKVNKNIPATRAWISSTALQNFMLSTGRATLLTDAQRNQVAIGDLVQFDWWNKGEEDHTGVVTRIDTAADGSVKIYYASHTAHGMWWSVDRSIRDIYPGATATYLHLAN